VVTGALSRRERAALALLGGLLPAGFRERQRDEWAGDLVALAGGDRRRYLIGAARTLPILRSQVRNHPAARAVVLDMPAGLRETFARMLLIGLGWPVLSWLVWLPGRYYLSGVPGRLERSGYMTQIDPNSVWPLGHTPDWLLPLWAVPFLGSYVAMYGPALLLSVGLVGGSGAGLRNRRHLVDRAALNTLTLGSVLVGLVLFLISSVVSLTTTSEAAGAVPTEAVVAVLGVTAVALGAGTPTLARRTRAALIALGAATIPLLLSFHTAAGDALYTWLAD
jgi:hypothetical protein